MSNQLICAVCSLSVLVPMQPLLLVCLLLGQSAAAHERGAIGNRPVWMHTIHLAQSIPPQSPLHFTRQNHRYGKALTLRGGAAASMRLVATPMAAYASALSSAPIITKALTSGTIFGLSDICAQGIAPSKDGKRDWTRTTVSALVGLLYFGPAAHAWYEAITAFLPGGGVQNTLIKTALGQGIFGPVFTCIFFGATIMATSGLGGLKTLPAKVKRDLLPTQLAGLGFWPFVDLVSYGFIPIMWIPLFINACSFVWTIFLSIQSSRGAPSN